MQVEIANAPAHANLEGVNHYFCCDGCRDHFLAQRQLVADLKPLAPPPPK